MLDQLLNVAQNQLSDYLYGDQDVDNQIAEPAAQVASSTIISGIMDMAKNGQLGGLLNMFSGYQTNSNNSIVNALMPTVVSSISQKLGVNPAIAQMIASKAVPYVLNMFNGKVNKTEHANNNFDIIGTLTGLLGGNTQAQNPQNPNFDDIQVNPQNPQQQDILSTLLNTFLGGGQQQQVQPAPTQNPQLDMITNLLQQVVGGTK